MNSCIYKIQIDKPVNKTQLTKIIKQLLGKSSDYKLTDKKKYYEIIHLNRSYFKPKGYQKQKHENITVIVGELKKKHVRLHGSGFISDIFNNVKNKVTDIFSVKLDFNNKAKKMLNTYGDKPISKISVFRTPISNAFKTIINKVSLGGLDTMMKQVGYDKLFHLAIILRIDNKNVLLEKNQIINIDLNYTTNENKEFVDVLYVSNSLKLNHILYNCLHQ